MRGSQGDTYRHHFEPELGQLLRAIAAAFHRLAETVAAPCPAVETMDLARAVSALDDKVTALRNSGVSLRYSLEEVSRFYAFFIGAKSLVKALTWAETCTDP
jgi:hypothetical protein